MDYWSVYINMEILTGAGISAVLLADYFITPVLLRWAKSFGKEINQKSHFEQAADNNMATAGQSCFLDNVVSACKED